MSKSCCFAVVLAVICLSVILLSLEADAQPTIDETMTCSASTLEEVVNMVKIVASNQQQNAQKIKDEIKDGIKSVKTLLASGNVKTNETRLEEVVQEIKDMIDSKMDLLRDEVNNGKRLLVTLEPSKQSLQVFGLLCEYVRCS